MIEAVRRRPCQEAAAAEIAESEFHISSPAVEEKASHSIIVVIPMPVNKVSTMGPVPDWQTSFGHGIEVAEPPSIPVSGYR